MALIPVEAAATAPEWGPLVVSAGSALGGLAAQELPKFGRWAAREIASTIPSFLGKQALAGAQHLINRPRKVQPVYTFRPLEHYFPSRSGAPPPPQASLPRPVFRPNGPSPAPTFAAHSRPIKPINSYSIWIRRRRRRRRVRRGRYPRIARFYGL